MSSFFSAYVPCKIRDMVSGVIAEGNVETCLETLRQKYPKLSSFRTATSRLKAGVLDANPHHPEYESSMAAHEEALRQLFRETLDDDVLKRVQQLYAFRNCPLKRQLQIQKKMRMGEMDMFHHPDDVAFILALKTAPDYVAKIRLTDEETRSFMQQQCQQQKSLSETVVRVENGDELVFEARNVLKNPEASVVDTMTALALTTGRRMIELFQRGQFIEIPGRKYACLFTGQAKTGLRHIKTIDTDQVIGYDIPILAPIKVVRAAHARVRAQCQCSDLHPKAINGKWCSRLNANVKASIHPGLGFHDMRCLYAILTYEAFKPHTFGINGWVSKCLGNGLVMSVHYTRIQVFGINKIRRTTREATEDYCTQDEGGTQEKEHVAPALEA